MSNRQRVVNYSYDGVDASVAEFVADVLELAGAFRREANDIARREGQTQTSWYALSVFSGDPLTVAQAARRLGTSRQAVQRSANELVEQGLATVEANPDHRTSPYIRLTEKGTDVLQTISRAATVARRRWLPDQEAAELETAHAVIIRLLAALRDGT